MKRRPGSSRKLRGPLVLDNMGLFRRCAGNQGKPAAANGMEVHEKRFPILAKIHPDGAIGDFYSPRKPWPEKPILKQAERSRRTW